MRRNLQFGITAIAGACFALTACQNSDQKTSKTLMAGAVQETPALYPLRKQFACLPAEAAFVAAHRAVSKGEGYAENSASSLQALIEKGVIVAEVDVAGLKDGTLILYHDGVWEEKSTGNGPVASSSWADAENILLKDTDGQLTSDRPVTFDDVLTMAKDKLYLEIDFKSSAKYDAVIKTIREHGMADRVILIAYTDAQARALARLAPEMLLSVGLRKPADITTLEGEGVARKNMTAWLGQGPYDPAFVQVLKDTHIPILAWPDHAEVDKTAIAASLIVSDYAFKLEPIMGLTQAGQKQYESCLKN